MIMNRNTWNYFTMRKKLDKARLEILSTKCLQIIFDINV